MKNSLLFRFFALSMTFFTYSTLIANDAEEAKLTFSEATTYRAFPLDLYAALNIDPTGLNIDATATDDDSYVIVFDENSQSQLEWMDRNYPTPYYDRYGIQSLNDPQRFLCLSGMQSLPAKISYREGKAFVEEFPVALDCLNVEKINYSKEESVHKEELKELFTLPKDRHAEEIFAGSMLNGTDYSRFLLSTDLGERRNIEGVFFDGREPQQLHWAMVNHPQSAWGIVKGSRRALQRLTGHPVISYNEVDLYTAFGIETLPAKVSITRQEGEYYVVVEQFALGEETAEHKQVAEKLKPTLYEFAWEAWFN